MAPLLLTFLPSPLLGPSVWRPVARVLAAQGWPTSICTVPETVLRADDVLDAFVAALPADQDVVLVPHSNAGAYVPALTVQRPVAAVIFVDAVLPQPGGHIPLAPPAFLDYLREKADENGLLPPWTEWWDEVDVAALFPDGESRARAEQEQQRLPLSYFTGSLAVPRGWDQRPCAYVAFGDTYTNEREAAVQRGWPARTLPAGHLLQLHDPDLVAETLINMLGQILPPPPE
jgi:pimeloyl-ACP methyl ester carboxylesterase